VRRLAEGATELAAEVSARKAGGTGEILDTQRLEVAGVGEIPRAQQMADGRHEKHASVHVRPAVPRKLIVAFGSGPASATRRHHEPGLTRSPYSAIEGQLRTPTDSRYVAGTAIAPGCSSRFADAARSRRSFASASLFSPAASSAFTVGP